MLKTEFEVLSNGHRLRVARLGTGLGTTAAKGRANSPSLVFLHGYPDDLQIWSEVATRLSGHFGVTAFDWPGMGYSHDWKRPPGNVTPHCMADRLLFLFDEWGIERANLVGIDMGGQPALVFASMHPERTERLVVMNCLAFPDEKTSWEINLLRKLNLNRGLLRRFPKLVFDRAERTFLPRGTRLPAELRSDMWGAFRRGAVREFIIDLSSGYQHVLPELPDLYRAITRPTLILWGGLDKHFPPVHAVRLHASIRDSHLRVIPGAEHWMPWYLSSEIASWIGHFAS